MAFETYQANMASNHEAGRLVKIIQSIYTLAVEAEGIWTEYEAGTDTALVGSIEAIYPSGDRTVIDTAVGHLGTATNALETHASALLAAGTE